MRFSVSRQGQRSRSRIVRSTHVIAQALEQRRLFCIDPALEVVPNWTWPQPAMHAAGGDAAGGDAGQADIVWANRGVGSGANSDNFDSVWGTAIVPGLGITKAEEARRIVDQVIVYYEKIVTNFNRPDGTNQLMLNISMDLNNKDTTGFAPAGTIFSGGKPENGGLLLGSGTDGHGGGYWLDPTPGNNGEFDPQNGVGVESAFSSLADLNAPNAALGRDFFTLVAVEMTHDLGLSSDSGNLVNTNGSIVNTGQTNTSSHGYGQGTFFVFNGPDVKHLLTNFNSKATADNPSAGYLTTYAAHSAGPLQPGSTFTYNGVTYEGADDTWNAYTQGYDRMIPGEAIALMLKDGMGYTITNPNTLPTLYTVVNDAGRLHIHGKGDGNDTITVTQSGSLITVSVNTDNDTPATGPLPGAGDLPAYTASFDASSITGILIDGYKGNDNITVSAVKPMTILGGAGNDTINVTNTYSGIGLTVDGGNDDDTIRVGSTGTLGNGLDSIGQSFTVAGGAGNDTVIYDDAADPYGETYTLDASGVARANSQRVSVDSSIEAYVLSSGDSASTFNVVASGLNGPRVTVNAGGGNDTFAIGSANNLDPIHGQLDLRGEAGTDTIQFNDSADTFAETYNLGANSFSRQSGSNIAFQAEIVRLYAGTNNDTINLTGVANDQSTTINGGSGNDTITLGNGHTLDAITGPVTINGDAGTADAVVFDDASSGFANAYTLTATTFTRTSTAAVTYATTIESVTVKGGLGNDTFTATPSSTATYFLDGNSSANDALTVNIAGVTGTTKTPSSSTAGTFTFSNRLAVSYAGMESSVTTGGVNQVPTIGSLTASPNPVTAGSTTTLAAASVVDPDGSVSGVTFYRESNGVNGLQIGSDTTVGAGTPSGSNWTSIVSTTGFAAGAYTFYAIATDNSSASSATATTSLTVNVPVNHGPVISAIYAIPGTVATNANFALLAGTITDSDGTVTSVAFYKETNGINGLQIGSDTAVGTDTTANDGWFINPVFAGSTPGTLTCYAVASDSSGYSSVPATALVSVEVDTPPTMSNGTFLYQTAPNRISIQFSANTLPGTIGTSDLQVGRIGGGAVPNIDSVGYDANTHVATWTLHSPLADGNYQVTLPAGAVQTSLNTFNAAYSFNIFAKAGDADHNRSVDFNDLLTLAKNYNQGGKTFSQGDFDYSGTVEFNDLLILAKNYNTTLAGAAAADPLVQSASSVTTTRKRVSSDVLA